VTGLRQCVVGRRFHYNAPMLELGVKTLLAYLLGSLIGSLIVGQLRGGVDIRTLGSGNPGGTNALRTQGAAFAIWVILIDAGKGWVAAAVLPELPLPLVELDPGIDRLWLTVACSTAVVVGHVFPVWHGFRGGKGAATLVGVLLGLKPVALIPVLLVWLCVVMLSGFVGLATMLATAAFPAYIALSTTDPSAALLSFGCAMLLFVCYTHRSNIERMRAGTEHRAQRLWLLRKR
jgi:acyl phosphate:glycerol-3-phosphate acyltransferase